MMRIAKVALFCCISSGLPLAAQAPAFDTSGNGMLNGTYYFRHVLYAIGTTADSNGIIGDISEAIALYGQISFDGNGNYTIPNGIVSDSGLGSPDPLSCYLAQTTCTTGAAVTGTYSVSASGYGTIANPIVTGDFIYGLVSANGIFAGSSTETTSAYNDLFIGAPVPSTALTNSNFSGSYTVAGYLPQEDMLLQMNPNGAGNLGTVNVTGYYEGGGTATISQSNSNIPYFFSNSAAVVTFPTSATANFFSGQEYLYFSPDGNFFFGGSPTNGYDMIVGVRNASGTQNFQGLYYQAGIDQNLSDLSGGYADFDGYYGSFNASGNGSIIAHERLYDQIFTGSTYGWTFADSFTPPVTGAYTDTNESFQYAVGDGGAIRIGQGIGPYLGLTCRFPGPVFPGHATGIHRPHRSGERGQFRAVHGGHRQRRVHFDLRNGPRVRHGSCFEPPYSHNAEWRSGDDQRCCGSGRLRVSWATQRDRAVAGSLFARPNSGNQQRRLVERGDRTPEPGFAGSIRKPIRRSLCGCNRLKFGTARDPFDPRATGRHARSVRYRSRYRLSPRHRRNCAAGQPVELHGQHDHRGR